MRYMEIAYLSKSGLRIKNKQATIAIDPQDKGTYDAVLVLAKSVEEISYAEETVLVQGVGEYEIGGIKITGLRSEADMLYSMIVDGVEILIGKAQALEKMQHKLKEYNIVVVNCDVEASATFITSLAENVVMFYGEKATIIASSFGKENIKTVAKYSSTKDKLPTEVETVLLTSSV